MKANIAYAELHNQYPEIVDKLVVKVKKGKNKLRNSDPSTWEWGFDWCVRINIGQGVFTTQHLFDGTMHGQMEQRRLEQEREANMTFEEYWQHCKSGNFNDTFMCIYSKLGNGIVRSEETITSYPELLKEYAREFYEDIQEDKRSLECFNNLTPEQKHEETEALLVRIRRDLGFMEL